MSALRPLPRAGRFSMTGSGMAVRRRSGRVVRSITSRASARYASAPRDRGVVDDAGHAVTRRFAEPHVARDHGGEHLVLEEVAHVARDLLAEVRALVVHREQHAFDVERRVVGAAHAAHRAHEIGEAFEREELAVQRDEHAVGGDEAVQREQAERRRTVDHDVLEAVAQAVDEILQPALAVGHRDELDLGAREIAGGRHEGEPVDAREHHVLPRRAHRIGRQRVIDRARLSGALLEAEAAGRVALRIEVHEQRRVAAEREPGRKIDGRRGLADAALLVRDGDDTRMFVSYDQKLFALNGWLAYRGRVAGSRSKAEV